MENNAVTEQGHREFKERLDNICTQYAEKTAITYMRNDGSKTLFTFGEILERIHATKENFADVGLRSGDRVAIIAPHSPYAIMAGLSLAYSNITSVLIDAALPAKELNRLLVLSDVRAVLTVSNIYERLDNALISDIPVFNITTIANSLSPFNESIATVQKEATADPHFDVIVILYSSGTTAGIKGVMITYQAVIKSCELYLINTNLRADMTYLFVLPFSHVAGYSGAIHHIFSGCEIGMIEDVDASKLSAGLIDFQPIFFAMVPRVYDVIKGKISNEIQNKGKIVKSLVFALFSFSGFLRKHLGIKLSLKLLANIRNKVFGANIYGLGTGGAICKESTAEFYLNLGLEWANFYSMTETYVPTVGTGTLDRYPAGTVGYVNRHPGIKIKIHDPDEKGVGEIRVKTVLIMKGYFRDPELTAAAFDEDGYFKTGDLGYIDKKDYLHVTGRMKEAIMMHTGKKVAPSDVDAFYSAHCPDVALASCGVPNEDGTYDEIHLFVEKGELSLDEQQKLRKSLFEFSAQTSNLYHVSSIHFIDKLPLTSIGKVKRFQLKEIARALCEGG